MIASVSDRNTYEIRNWISDVLYDLRKSTMFKMSEFYDSHGVILCEAGEENEKTQLCFRYSMNYWNTVKHTHTHTSADHAIEREKKNEEKEASTRGNKREKSRKNETTSGEQFGRELEPRFILHRARIMLICGLIGGQNGDEIRIRVPCFRCDDRDESR